MNVIFESIILTIVSFLILFSCSEILQHDEYQKLSSTEHFDSVEDSVNILFNSSVSAYDTLLFVGKIKAQYEEELYTGIHCKGPYNYIEFEKIIFTLKQDTILINKKDILLPRDYYGFCHSEIPDFNYSFQFSYGYPMTKGDINAPLLILNKKYYDCSEILNLFTLNSKDYPDVYKYQLDTVHFRKYESIMNIYFSKSNGIIKIETLNDGDWNIL